MVTATDDEKGKTANATGGQQKHVGFSASTTESPSRRPAPMPFQKRTSEKILEAVKHLTEETSEAMSTGESSGDGQYEVIEYVLDHQDDMGDLFKDLDLAIEDDSPAAEALRANANVHVSSVGKAARAVHMQSVKRLVKRAAGVKKSGIVKGKPPRVPPPKQRVDLSSARDDDDAVIYEEQIEVVEDGRVGSSVGVPDESAEFLKHPKQPFHREDIHIPDGVAPGTVEAGKKVLGSVDPHDLLKLVRWKRRKRGVVKKPKSYVKGKVIDGEHELYTLSIAVMIGVRTSISRTNAELNRGPGKRWVRPADFRTTEKYEFRPKGKGPLPPHQLAHTFKFKDYSPLVFAYLRRMHGVNEFDFLLSVCGNANFIEFVSNAKSGQFFFYSSDGKYMIKTMTNAESKFLRRILPHYFKHCCENPNTMITRFFGMYRVKLYHLRRNVKFVIMNSVYYTDKILHTFYDLKGSVVGRSAKPGQAVLKDNDLRDGLPDDALALPPEQRANVRKQLVSDCAFLNRMGIMDYSMLVGVHYIPAFDDRSERVVKTHRRKPSLKTESLPARLEGPADSPRRKILSKSDQPCSQGESACTALVFEDGLDDDDSSYLVGSESRPNHQHTSFNEDTERKKLVTVEKLYWPFHHFFDIHGYRRMHPARCPTCNDTECKCSREDSKAVDGYKVPKFVAPLSDRKDGGFVMDTTGLQLPIVWKGPTGEQQCEGKIFYMGIIDILQEYNSRKSLESKYRRLRSSKMQASCVPPKNYGERFIDFFDEYTRRDLGGASEDEGVEVSVRNDES